MDSQLATSKNPLASLTVGEKIKYYRKQRGLNQRQVVAENYSVSYLSRVERGDITPSRDFLEFVAARLEIPSEELVKGNAQPRKPNRKAQELELMNAHVALQMEQPQAALNFLAKLDLQYMSASLTFRYYAIAGEARVKLKDFENGVADLRQALSLMEANRKIPSLEIERVRNWIGLAFYRQGQYQTALEYHHLCHTAIIDGRIQDPRFTMKIYSNMANEYHLLGDNETSLKYYRNALKLAEEGEDNLDQASIYWGMGLAYRGIDNLALSKLYFARSADLYDKIGEYRYAATLRGMLGRSMAERGEYAEAEVVFDAALESARNSQDSLVLQTAYVNLAYSYSLQKNYTRAVEYAYQGLDAAEKMADALLVGQAQAQLATILVEMGRAEEGFTHFQKAIARLEETQSAEYLGQAAFSYAEALEKAGDLAQAARYFRQAYMQLRFKKSPVTG